MTHAPKWFGRVAVAALLWNLIGCAAYLSDVMLSPDDIAAMSEAEQQMYAARPAWAVAATAIAVWGGALGCVGLIARRRWATPLLVASLAGVVGQDLGLLGLLGTSAPIGAAVVAMQGLVLAIAVALVWLARSAAAKGWLH
ncbi:MAG: hypothetical protein R2708_29400 [Vicinamibacterales bacterium]